MFDLTDEQQMLRDTVRRLAREKLAPRAAEVDRKGEFPWDNARLLREQGILTLMLPEEYGGAGANNTSFCLCIEEIARACGSSALMVLAQGVAAYPIVVAGGNEQKKNFYGQLSEGGKIAAFCVTEPDAGSDAGAIRTTAVKKGDSYILNGRKCFITNGAAAGLFTVFAKTDPAAGKRGMSVFVIEKDTPGLTVEKPEDKMGMRGSSTTEVVFEDAAVPTANLLGGEGEGFLIAMKTFDMSRPAVGALALGIAQGALDYAVNYARERVQFGKPIAEHQGIQFMLADMAMRVEASRGLVYRAARAFDTGAPGLDRLASMAKTFASDSAMAVTTDAVQILGGYGYSRGFPVERMMRDAKVTQIFEGTNQIQRMIIARSLVK